MIDDLGPDGVLEALQRALRDNPHLRDQPPEEVARQLVLGGYVKGAPDPGVVGEAMATVAAEERGFWPNAPPLEGS